ncbi:MAG: glycosyl hydrolase [Patescibacteria group bacterium]
MKYPPLPIPNLKEKLQPVKDIFYKYKKYLFTNALVLAIIFLILGLISYLTTSPKVIGMYDPDDAFITEKGITMRSDYFAWNKDLSVIAIELKRATEQQRAFLVTIEPWPEPVGFRYESNNDLLKAIIEGEYDQTTNNICDILSTAQVPVYIRWGHEMELENSRYPWSHSTPELYIQAYRHFVDTCRTKGNLFKFVWSPAGEAGLENYWPGKKYVDVIGLSIYSFDQYDEKHIGHKRSFKEVFIPRYDRVKNYRKPVLIAEIGVTGTDNYKLEWIGWMMNDLHNYKRLIGFVYLNTMDPQAVWEEGLDNPDWRLPKRATQLLFPKK